MSDQVETSAAQPLHATRSGIEIAAGVLEAGTAGPAATENHPGTSCPGHRRVVQTFGVGSLTDQLLNLDLPPESAKSG